MKKPIDRSIGNIAGHSVRFGRIQSASVPPFAPLSALTLSLAAALAVLAAPQVLAQATDISGRSSTYIWDNNHLDISVASGGSVIVGTIDPA
jgi:hypothetical protein